MSPDALPAPLFILCVGHSYSSVLCSMLGQHPQMFGLPEVNLFVTDTVGELYDQSMQRNRPGILHGLVRTLAELHDGVQDDATVAAAWQWLEAHRHTRTAEIFHYLCQRAAPRLCVDKSPVTAGQMCHLERLHAAFPHARLLHLTRHPLKVGQSLYRVKNAKLSRGRDLSVPNDPMLIEAHWVKIQTHILDFAARLPPGQCLRLPGELLMADPDNYLRQICEWLGVRADAEAIAAMKHPERSPFACIGPRRARFGNNADFLQNPALRSGPPPQASLHAPLPWLEDTGYFLKHTVALARRLGYQ